jgi:hypothetical protein
MSALDGQVGTSSFGSVHFWEPNADRGLVRPGKSARYQKDPIPYGTLATIQIGGGDTDPLTVQAMLKTADYPALEALCYTVGTLTLLGDSTRSALLAKMSNPKFYPDGRAECQLLFEFA